MQKCIFYKEQSAIFAGTLSVQQQTYGIATGLRITCGNGHNVEIIPEHINTLEVPKNLSSTTNYSFLCNFWVKVLLLSQHYLVYMHHWVFILHGKPCLISLGQSKPILCNNVAKKSSKRIDETIAKGNYEMCGEATSWNHCKW